MVAKLAELHCFVVERRVGARGAGGSPGRGGAPRGVAPPGALRGVRVLFFLWGGREGGREKFKRRERRGWKKKGKKTTAWKKKGVEKRK